MNQQTEITKRVSPARNSISHSLSLITSHHPAASKVKACSPRRAATEGGSLFTILQLAFCCFALSSAPSAFAVTPAPDGGYPGANTAEGQNALQSLSSGIQNTALGYQTLFSNTTGINNTATGFRALYNNTTGRFNTANGFAALLSNTTGNSNTANGVGALQDNTTGVQNTAGGDSALKNNTAGAHNVADGYQALYSNTSGNYNTATGWQALYSNTSGNYNTANGVRALYSNTTGSFNTANGSSALFVNGGDDNTATGFNALINNFGSNNTANGAAALVSNYGDNNTATGVGALSHNGGDNNTAAGFNALLHNQGNGNTADGCQALYNNTTGGGNTALGSGAGLFLTTGNNNIDIANGGVAGESNTIRIGTEGGQAASFIAGIYGETTGSTTTLPVIVDVNGQLGTAASSERFKTEIKPMDRTSEAILGLKPVTFHYKSDRKGTPQFGLIAEEVAKVNPELVARDRNGEIYTVRYEAVNAMLLNEFLKEHRKVQDLEKQVEKLTAGLQKVSDQLELSKPAPRMVGNRQ
jgi:hypothetical protein